MTNEHDTEGMGEIVQTVARWLKGPILLYGIYIVFYGHLTPGGGFAGGVIVAAAFILLMLAAGGRQALGLFSRSAASTLDSVGILVFLALAVLGMWFAGGVFFHNFIPTPAQAWFTLFSAGTMPISNIGLGVKVASSIFLVFTVLAALRIIAGGGPEKG